MKIRSTYFTIRSASTGALLSAFVLFLTGCERSEEQSVTGALTVSYEIQISADTRKSETGEYGEIQILDQYVILNSEDGKGGVIIPRSKINQLVWRKK